MCIFWNLNVNSSFSSHQFLVPDSSAQARPAPEAVPSGGGVQLNVVLLLLLLLLLLHVAAPAVLVVAAVVRHQGLHFKCSAEKGLA